MASSPMPNLTTLPTATSVATSATFFDSEAVIAFWMDYPARDYKG
jgi:hypothetical protein